MEDVDYQHPRGLQKAVMLDLATCRWVDAHQNVIFSGLTGVGKSYLACALGQKACREGRSVVYRRASRLYDELAQARADGTYLLLLRRLAKTDVLVVDDFGLEVLSATQRRDFLEVMEDRYGISSTVITSQLDPKELPLHHRRRDHRRLGLRPPHQQRTQGEAQWRVAQEDEGRLDQWPEAGEVDLPSGVTPRVIALPVRVIGIGWNGRSGMAGIRTKTVGATQARPGRRLTSQCNRVSRSSTRPEVQLFPSEEARRQGCRIYPRLPPRTSPLHASRFRTG